MLRRLLATVVALGLLAFGATVSLEAFGLLFHVGVADPEQRAAAFVARLEADLSRVDLPTEPVEGPVEAQQAGTLPDAERVAAAEPAHDNARETAEVENRTDLDKDGGEQLAGAFTGKLPIAPAEAAIQPEAEPPMSASSREEPVPAELPAQLASQAPAELPAGSEPLRAAGAGRAYAMRARPTGYAAFGWPVLDWLY